MPRPTPLGTLIDGIWEAREKKRTMQAAIDKVEADIKEREEALIERLGKEGADKATGKKASVSVTETIVPNIVDWDKFCAYVKKNDYFHLMHRRVTTEGARELFEKNGQIPGLEAFKKKKLSIRTVNQE